MAEIVKPIILSGDEVRAILLGAKTQIRRPVKTIGDCFWSHRGYELRPTEVGCFQWFWKQDGTLNPHGPTVHCPFGRVGTTLWVRETFSVSEGYRNEPDVVGYRADDSVRYFQMDTPIPKDSKDISTWTDHKSTEPWMPAPWMPKWASRISLQVAGIKPQRVQEITEDDAKAEGVRVSSSVEMKDGSPCYSIPFQESWTARYGINNPKAWEKDPWVWVVSFDPVVLGEAEGG